MRFATWACAAAAAAIGWGLGSAQAQAPLPLERIALPPGFAIELVARVPNARAMTWGDKGTLFVGSNEGSVHAVTFAGPAASGPATVQRIAQDLREPAGVAFRDGALYVSARSSPIASRRKASMAASSSRSAPTASCTCRSARRATSARLIPTATRTSSG